MSNDGTAGGAIQALAAQKLAGKVAVSGQDADIAAVGSKLATLGHTAPHVYAGWSEWSADESLPLEDRFEARLKLAELPRNSSPTRIRNRCEITGRPRAYYRKLRMSRIALRDLGSAGLIPGLVKSSW